MFGRGRPPATPTRVRLAQLNLALANNVGAKRMPRAGLVLRKTSRKITRELDVFDTNWTEKIITVLK